MSVMLVRSWTLSSKAVEQFIIVGGNCGARKRGGKGRGGRLEFGI